MQAPRFYLHASTRADDREYLLPSSSVEPLQPASMPSSL
ncbi:hypothetical protein BURMUCF1_1116 [Burkholderia multivorans ATCC BAA-247]|uniref:Uncharacterized protein n=1 Tax=Burkholderia multivorans CGD2 TaxID=513052 RepID=B9BNH5_9BURK|nr:hypothetical protein BURMUCGD2_2405 [Burkholderia multivorans CGD2]EEE10466.1 hypothetical protein BURMUCGD2M_2491 [Burkholderia multivorans CGD2M]EJO52900.1 hypothetical protein BURMUCF1_1116 [Burkholderia multivorans ATCC BAA-247]